MAESGPDNQSSAPGGSVAEFGDNEWLVDEMFERYQDDPSSVDDAWLASRGTLRGRRHRLVPGGISHRRAQRHDRQQRR